MHLLKGMSIAWIAALSKATTATPLSRCTCSEVTFQISATAQNVVFASPPDQSNETAVLNFFNSAVSKGLPTVKGTAEASGVYTIDGNYCWPAAQNDKNVLQLLVHGISYNKDTWNGLGMGSTYNWQQYAANQGYSTLAIDRLGHGTNPQRPDPLNVVQGYLSFEIMHQLITTIRKTKYNPLARSFNSIVWVSHSYAAWLASGLVSTYPTDVDAMVHLGFSVVSNFTTFAKSQIVSASVLDPVKFPSLPLGYITFAQESQREAFLFAPGGYDPAVARRDYQVQDTFTLGETTNLGFVVPAAKYVNPVYVATGVEDVLFCHPPLATCQAILNATRALYPAVKNYVFNAIPTTGHSVMLHNSAPLTFADVHKFLDGVFK